MLPGISMGHIATTCGDAALSGHADGSDPDVAAKYLAEDKKSGDGLNEHPVVDANGDGAADPPDVVETDPTKVGKVLQSRNPTTKVILQKLYKNGVSKGRQF